MNYNKTQSFIKKNNITTNYKNYINRSLKTRKHFITLILKKKNLVTDYFPNFSLYIQLIYNLYI